MVPRRRAADRVMKMQSTIFGVFATPLPSNLPAIRCEAQGDDWLRLAQGLHASGARLLTVWGADDRDRNGSFRVRAAWLTPEGLVFTEHRIADTEQPSYPSLAELFPTAARMQRAVFDLLGIRATGADMRGWLRHSGWPEDVFPLRRDFDSDQDYPVTSQPYPFVLVEGDGVHEIAVGPVHAGIIEPGHFRFSVVGEKILRLEERLGYTHKGIAKLFQGSSQDLGHRLAARISGDSAVAFSWAWCAALEAITQTVCPERAIHLRALALEHERVANHLGDLGVLGNDAGFAFGLTQFSRMKEDLLRANADLFGARYLMDFILPGGVGGDLPGYAAAQLLHLYRELEDGVASMRSIYDEHAGIQDRFREAGRLTPDLAEKLGAVGLAARASGIARDLRADHPWAPYDQLAPEVVTQTSGDVAARVQVRFDEIVESLRLCRALLGRSADGLVRANVPPAEPNRTGIGLIEGWRGPVMIALETGPEGTIRWCHAEDPSVQNWPLLEYAVIGNIVPDFPLINKSFNLSYSGQDG
jgi:Ni,Fe-hydrogenase III large subunit/Ni,Fe-hydrogenase III component G